MFGKKETKITIIYNEECIRIKGNKDGTVGEVKDIIKALAEMIERQTGIKANIILSKCAFEMIK